MKNKLTTSRWYRIIPVIFVTYSLAYLDRANFGFGLAGGMSKDLHITSTVSSFLGSLFFLGYFFSQIPGVYYAENKSIKKLIFWALIFWGLFAMATGIISEVKILMLIRFMLGVVEGVVFPLLLILLSRWFTRTERSRANTFLIFGNPATILWMSILSGYLIKAIGWRGMFIWEGIPAIVWAVFWRVLVVDRPGEAGWLIPSEKEKLQKELQREQAAIKPVKNYLSAFKSSTVILLCLVYALWSIGVYGFVIWLPSMINTATQIGIVKTGWLSSFPYALAIVGMITVSYFSDKALKRKPFVWVSLLIGSITFYCSYLAGSHTFLLSFSLLSLAGMAMYAPYGPFFSILTEILPSNVAGGTLALINSLGALGSFAGSYFVGYLHGRTGSFGSSYLFIAGSLFLSAILVAFAVRDAGKSM